MSSIEVRAGRIGRTHALDGSFYVDSPEEALTVGAVVRLGERETTIEKVAGTAARPIVRVHGVDTREAARALRGESLYVERPQEDLSPDEYLAQDLVGCQVAGVGAVRRVVNGPSCDLLEVGDEGVLIPFVRDAIRRVDTSAGTIEVDRGFLGLT